VEDTRVLSEGVSCETESRETLDEFTEAMIAIAKEAQENPGIIHYAPHRTKVGRVDEVKAARASLF